MRLTDTEIDAALRVCAEAQEAMDAFLAAGATAKMIERPLETVARMVLPRALKELKEARKDTDRLDYLQSTTKGYGHGWILRESYTGRGMRLHETSMLGAGQDVRAAIDQARGK